MEWEFTAAAEAMPHFVEVKQALKGVFGRTPDTRCSMICPRAGGVGRLRRVHASRRFQPDNPAVCRVWPAGMWH